MRSHLPTSPPTCCSSLLHHSAVDLQTLPGSLSPRNRNAAVYAPTR